MKRVYMDTLLDKCPSWAYIVILVVAFLIALSIAGIGIRVLSNILQKMRPAVPDAGNQPQI